jgi:hypothetical protein
MAGGDERRGLAGGDEQRSLAGRHVDSLAGRDSRRGDGLAGGDGRRGRPARPVGTSGMVCPAAGLGQLGSMSDMSSFGGRLSPSSVLPSFGGRDANWQATNRCEP